MLSTPNALSRPVHPTQLLCKRGVADTHPRTARTSAGRTRSLLCPPLAVTPDTSAWVRRYSAARWPASRCPRSCIPTLTIDTSHRTATPCVHAFTDPIHNGLWRSSAGGSASPKVSLRGSTIVLVRGGEDQPVITDRTRAARRRPAAQRSDRRHACSQSHNIKCQASTTSAYKPGWLCRRQVIITNGVAATSTLAAILDRLGALSSAVEHCAYNAGVTGSNPVAPTTYMQFKGYSAHQVVSMLKLPVEAHCSCDRTAPDSRKTAWRYSPHFGRPAGATPRSAKAMLRKSSGRLPRPPRDRTLVSRPAVAAVGYG